MKSTNKAYRIFPLLLGLLLLLASTRSSVVMADGSAVEEELEEEENNDELNAEIQACKVVCNKQKQQDLKQCRMSNFKQIINKKKRVKKQKVCVLKAEDKHFTCRDEGCSNFNACIQQFCINKLKRVCLKGCVKGRKNQFKKLTCKKNSCHIGLRNELELCFNSCKPKTVGNPCTDDTDCISGSCGIDVSDRESGNLYCCTSEGTDDDGACFSTKYPVGDSCLLDGDCRSEGCGLHELCSNEKFCCSHLGADDNGICFSSPLKVDGQTCSNNDDECRSCSCGLKSYLKQNYYICCDKLGIDPLSNVCYSTWKTLKPGSPCPLNYNAICDSGYCGLEICCDETGKDPRSGGACFDTCDVGSLLIGEDCYYDQNCDSGQCGRDPMSSRVRCCGTKGNDQTCGELVVDGSVCYKSSECNSGTCTDSVCT